MMDFVNDQEIERIYDADRRRRVRIYMRRNGSYGLYWEEYSDHAQDECFVPSAQGTSFIDTLETARREARGRLESL